jgi:hypothetical protein
LVHAWAGDVSKLMPEYQKALTREGYIVVEAEVGTFILEP